MNKIGVTTTVPIEVLLAAGHSVVDLNNEFITSKDYHKYLDLAEKEGFPKSLCAWIKGIYGACKTKNIDEIIGVMEGDCSNTKSLLEVLELEGKKIYPFAFPTQRNIDNVKVEIDRFMKLFNVDSQKVEEVRQRLNKVRMLAKKIDLLTYEDNKVSGFENHLFQVSLSDFASDVDDFEKLLEAKIKEFEEREPFKQNLRLAYIGVPPMTGDLYEYVESLDARVVYNEVQREFAFPRCEQASDIYQQYYDYTYPYDVWFRLSEIKKQIKERKIDAVIHYTQAFCHKAIEQIVISKELDIPVLNIEGDKLNELDARTKLRIEAFLDMLSDVKGASK